jgi:hypothetical protein
LYPFVESQALKPMFRSVDDVKPAIISKKSRIANIERLRIVSIYAVVSFHTHRWFPNSLCFAGLIILLLCSCAFVVNKPEVYGQVDLVK